MMDDFRLLAKSFETAHRGHRRLRPTFWSVMVLLHAWHGAQHVTAQTSPNREWACDGQDYTLLTTTSKATGTMLVARRGDDVLAKFQFKTAPGEFSAVTCTKSDAKKLQDSASHDGVSVIVVSKPHNTCATRTTSLTFQKMKFSLRGEQTDDPCARNMEAFRKAATSGDTAQAVAELDSLALPEHYIKDGDWHLLLDTALRESERHDRAGRSADAVRTARDATDRLDQILGACRAQNNCTADKKRIKALQGLARIIRKNGAAGIADILDRELSRLNTKVSP